MDIRPFKFAIRWSLLALLLCALQSQAQQLDQCIREGMIRVFLDERGLTAKSDQIAHGSYFTRKAIRSLIDSARPSENGFKHASARTLEDAREKSTHTAQYFPNTNHVAIERSVLQSKKGEWFTHGRSTLFKFERLNQPVGFDQGEETRWVRVEITSGVFHGQPVSLERVRKYLKDAQP